MASCFQALGLLCQPSSRELQRQAEAAERKEQRAKALQLQEASLAEQVQLRQVQEQFLKQQLSCIQM